jgi:anti-sigma factor RsiW
MSRDVQPITCQEVVELVTDYLEGAIPPDEVARCEHHLSLCEGCVSYVDQIRMTVAAVGRIDESDVAPETRDELVAAFRDFKRAAG